MNRLLGIETEYGITIEGEEDVDPVIESVNLIKSYRPDDPTPRWDYSLEDPFADARGFRADELQEHPDEEEEQKKDKRHRLSFEQVKSDRILRNGARLYNDHAHPEYSTPECRGLFDLVAHDRAGERILLQCARRRSEELGKNVLLYKNNTDFVGHSYGCHDNYLMSRDVPFAYIKDSLIPFNVTRQIFAGAGKVGIETEEGMSSPGHYQLSQRADFFSVDASVDTMHARPLVNTRDEPHADRTKYRRLHGIAGDANMCEYATALKVGTTALVIDLIERRVVPETLRLARPLDAVKTISHDHEYDWTVTMGDGSVSNAVEVQRQYLALAVEHLADNDDETEWILHEWASTLDALERDPMELVGALDWVTKRWLLDMFREEEGVEWSDPWLISLDLEYHNIDLDAGLYYELQKDSAVRQLVKEEDILKATEQAPSDTRAYLRGGIMAKFGDSVTAAQWDSVTLKVGFQRITVSLNDLVEPEALTRYSAALDAHSTPADFLKAVGLMR
ncbi:MAG: proteasome accessory factor PafA2 family protein [Candidatus Poribacteria bacterium]|nr:proteasome accessory factor PafA2 family protein [Candidatus Poribacteria bacterium]